MADEQILQARIEQLEAWVSEVIARPSMSRDARWKGLDLLEESRAINPKVRKSVERICPRRFIEHGLELEQTIER